MPGRPTVDADIAVVGAGPAGAAAALFAARRGRHVVVLEKQAFPRDKPCGEGLMPSGRSPLRELGLDAIVTAQGAPPLNGVQFGLPHQPLVAVPFPEHRGDQAGLGIRRLDFDARLADALSRDPRIEFCQHTKVREIRRDPDGRSILSTTSGDVRARYVAVADGLRSDVRHRLGWTVGPRPPHRYGIVGHWLVGGPVDPWVRNTFYQDLEVYEGPVAGNQRMVGLLCYQPRMRDFSGRLATRYREIVLSLRPELRDAELVGPVAAAGPFWYRASTVAPDGIFLVGHSGGVPDPIPRGGIAAGLRQARAIAPSPCSPQSQRAQPPA